jgi:hypothetical protein
METLWNSLNLNHCIRISFFFNLADTVSRTKKSRYLEFGGSNTPPEDVLLRYISDQYSILMATGIGIDEAIFAAATATLSCEGMLVMRRNVDMTEILLLVDLVLIPIFACSYRLE